MDWAVIIAMLIKDLYPILIDAFQRWLDKLLPKAQKSLEAKKKLKGTRKELLEEALRISPFNPLYRAMLRRMIEIEGKPTAADKKELKGLAQLGE